MKKILLIFLFLAALQGVNSKTFRVFLIAGQSNMQGQGVVDLDHPKYYNGGKGTLVRIMEQTKTPILYKHLRDRDGKWVERMQ